LRHIADIEEQERIEFFGDICTTVTRALKEKKLMASMHMYRKGSGLNGIEKVITGLYEIQHYYGPDDD